MSTPPRDRTSFGSNIYFVTAGASGHRPLLQTEDMAGLLIDTLQRYRQEGKFLLHEFVVMPNHFHLLITPSGVPIEKAVQFIKGGFSFHVQKELGLNFEIWERAYVDHRIREARDHAHHTNYIHQNPVSARITGRPEDYRYSSAHARLDLDPCLQGLKPYFRSA